MAKKQRKTKARAPKATKVKVQKKSRKTKSVGKKKRAKKLTKKGVAGMRRAKPRSNMMILAADHPDQRYPVHGNPDREIVCKWIDGQTQCREVPKGGDW